jgi:hypothetical protein
MSIFRISHSCAECTQTPPGQKLSALITYTDRSHILCKAHNMKASSDLCRYDTNVGFEVQSRPSSVLEDLQSFEFVYLPDFNLSC